MDYGMFTAGGNAAVHAIIEQHVEQAQDHNDLYDRVLGDLERLQTVTAFREATDTEVRERVYQQCLKLFPVPVFVSRRKKKVDTA